MIDGVATVTIVVSTRILENPRQSTNSAGQGRMSSGVAAVERSDSVGPPTDSTPGPGASIPRPRLHP
jgi:hypothetical protein